MPTDDAPRTRTSPTVACGRRTASPCSWTARSSASSRSSRPRPPLPICCARPPRGSPSHWRRRGPGGRRGAAPSRPRYCSGSSSPRARPSRWTTCSGTPAASSPNSARWSAPASSCSRTARSSPAWPATPTAAATWPRGSSSATPRTAWSWPRPSCAPARRSTADRDSGLLSGWWVDNFHVASGLAVPIGRSPHLAGVLTLDSTQVRPFSEDVRRLAAAAGAHLGGVIEQARTSQARAASLATARVVRQMLVDGSQATGHLRGRRDPRPRRPAARGHRAQRRLPDRRRRPDRRGHPRRLGRRPPPGRADPAGRAARGRRGAVAAHRGAQAAGVRRGHRDQRPARPAAGAGARPLLLRERPAAVRRPAARAGRHRLGVGAPHVVARGPRGRAPGDPRGRAGRRERGAARGREAPARAAGDRGPPRPAHRPGQPPPADRGAREPPSTGWVAATAPSS